MPTSYMGTNQNDVQRWRHKKFIRNTFAAIQLFIPSYSVGCSIAKCSLDLYELQNNLYVILVEIRCVHILLFLAENTRLLKIFDFISLLLAKIKFIFVNVLNVTPIKSELDYKFFISTWKVQISMVLKFSCAGTSYTYLEYW